MALRLEEVADKAIRVVDNAVEFLNGEPAGTVAARVEDENALNYDQVFVRDFFVSALSFLMRDQPTVVRNVIRHCIELQVGSDNVNCTDPSRGAMPASYKVDCDQDTCLVGDYGDHAIGRVVPADSGFWWLWLLRIYTRMTGDRALAEDPKTIRAIHLILRLHMVSQYDTFPTLLVPDGSFMIDRRMGVYGYPLEIQTLFFAGLRSARELLPADDPWQPAIRSRLRQVRAFLHENYWLDLERLNQIYRYSTEEFGQTIVNHLNIQPASIPEWIFNWMPQEGGYFAGNVGPSRIDFRYFAQGNFIAALSGVADCDETVGITRLVESQWDRLVGSMPLTIAYPPLRAHEWELLTGCDPKNTAWSYHNGGRWPTLLWSFAGVAIQANRADLLERALETAAQCLAEDDWPEYYDGPLGRLIGKQARLRQTWSAAGFHAALSILKKPEALDAIGFEDEPDLTASFAEAGSESAGIPERD